MRMKPRLIVEQKITPFVNRYAIYEAAADGTKEELIAFAQQKRITFKEKITFYTSEQKTDIAFTLRAEKVFDVHGRYFVEDASGALLGALRKQFKKSLIRSSWKVLDSSEKDILEVHENNLLLALIRRFGGFLPVVGGFVDILVDFFRYHFVFMDESSKQEVGQYHKFTLFRDHYRLSMTDEAYDAQDWRVLAAMGVALDALQSR